MSAKSFKEAGFDFVIFDPDKAAATALFEENIGYVMSVPSDLSDAEIRTLEGFQLDAIHVGVMKARLTVRRQIDLRRLVVDDAEAADGLGRCGDRACGASGAAGDERGRRGRRRGRRTSSGCARRSMRCRRATKRKDSEERPMPFVPHSATVGDGDEHDARGRRLGYAPAASGGCPVRERRSSLRL